MGAAEKRWELLTNHGHALVCLAHEPDIRLVDLAARIGVRERSAHRIVSDLVEAGYVTRERRGNRAVYEVHLDRPMRRAAFADVKVGELVALLVPRDGEADAARFER